MIVPITQLTTLKHLIAAESQLMATRLALEGERNEVARLNLQIELLEKEHTLQKREIDDMKKTMNKQKSDIKRLTKDNDSLRREISRYNGMIMYTGETHGDIVDNSNKLVADVSNAHNEFRDKITGIASLLVDALDYCSDKNSDFITVTNRRGKSPPNAPSTYSHVVSSGPTMPPAGSITSGQLMPQPVAAHRRRPSCPPPHQGQSSRGSTSCGQNGHAIPVVRLGIGRQHTPSTPPARPATNQRQRPPVAGHSGSQQYQRPATSGGGGRQVIGTSLIDGLGQRLNKLRMPATTYVYRGATVPVLQSRVRHILTSRDQPDQIVLHCGGNDAERQPADVVTARIETLVHAIRRLSPRSDIIINKVPPRGNNKKVLDNIQRLNSSLDLLYHGDDHVKIIDVCPKSHQFYRRDLVHFNSKGSFMFAEQLADKLSNFYWLEKQMWI